MKLLKNKHFLFIILITAFVLIAYREIAFMQYTPVYDIIDAYFPWRYFIGECLQNRSLPLWEPYQHLGTPIHANPHSGAWYPFVWFFGYLFGYNMTIMNLEITFHLIIAALGFYFLLNYLKVERKHAALFACIYVFSGFFIGNAQHFSWIISATWVPIIFLFYLKTIEKPNFKNKLLISVFIFLLISGGYPAFTLILGYIFFAISLYKVFYNYKRKINSFELVKTNGIILLFSAILSSVIIVSVYNAAQWFSRANPLEFDKANVMPFTPQSLLSSLFPFATTQDSSFFKTDISMSNAYFGVIAMFIIIHACLYYYKRKQTLYLTLSLLFFLLAMGSATSFYKIVFDYLPGFSYFRVSSLIRYFGISAIIIGVAMHFKIFIEEINLKKIAIPSLLLLLLLGLIMLFSYFKYGLKENTLAQNNFYIGIIKQGLVQYALILAATAILMLLKNNKTRFYLIAFLLIFDIYYAGRLNFPFTVVSSTKVKDFNKSATNFTKGFPINKDTISKFDEYKFHQVNLYRNLAIYQKKHSLQGFNSFILTRYLNILDNDSLNFYTARPLLFSEDSMAKITINSYTPNKIIATIHSKNNNQVVLLQNYMPDWEITIDGIQAKAELYKDTFIKFPVSKSSRIIEIEYRPQSVIFALWVTIISLIMLFSALVLICLTSGNSFYRASKHETTTSYEN